MNHPADSESKTHVALEGPEGCNHRAAVWRYFITLTTLRCVCVSLSMWEGLKGNFSSSLLPISPQSEETVVQFHPPASFHHPQPQLIGVPDRCHMHLWFILVRVCARMYVYIHLNGVKEMFPARVTIKTLTPRSSFRLPDCQMFSTWFHIHSELLGRCSGLAQVLPLSPNYKHSMTYSAQMDDLMPANAFQAFRSESWNTDWAACLPSTCHKLGKKTHYF